MEGIKSIVDDDEYYIDAIMKAINSYVNWKVAKAKQEMIEKQEMIDKKFEEIDKDRYDTYIK